MHSSGHHLGLDVHDLGIYREGDEPIKFAKDMFITIEPGLYFNPKTTNTKFANIGVRIEDDVLITNKGCKLLSNVIKEVSEIENV